MFKSLGKKMSSSKLLKCILLNTAVELFGCINTPSYFITPVESYYWDMENLDHFYATLSDAHSQCPESSDTASLTERITAQVHAPDIQSTEEHNELLKPEQLPSSLDTLLTVDLSTWLHWTVTEKTTESNESKSLHQNFYFLIPADLVTHVITILNETDMENDLVLFSDCGVQTDNPDQENKTTKTQNPSDTEISFYDLQNCIDGIDTTQSILWDSYDLHESNKKTSGVSEKWCLSIEDKSRSYEDLMLMDLSKQFKNNRENPVSSSTPCLNRKKSMM
ncbi:uncharacterized protein [Pyxicephalus adspersus]|uniref:uncharacterized protein n=1 Tax=Pyxicephalus adspersus TaxID=30357 RepID=UPI003B5B0E54